MVLERVLCLGWAHCWPLGECGTIPLGPCGLSSCNEASPGWARRATRKRSQSSTVACGDSLTLRLTPRLSWSLWSLRDPYSHVTCAKCGDWVKKCRCSWSSSFLGRCVMGVSGNLDLFLNERSCHAMLRWLTRKPWFRAVSKWFIPMVLKEETRWGLIMQRSSAEALARRQHQGTVKEMSISSAAP